MPRASIVAILAVLVVFAAQGGGAAGQGAGEVSAQDGVPSAQAVVEYDDLLAEVAAAVPGFGGLFLDKDGALNVYLLDPAQKTSATAAIGTVFGPDRFPGETRAVQGKYDFLQLYEWKKGLRQNVLGLPGVISLDIDDFANRLVVGVESAKVQGSVEQQLDKLTIPSEAVDIRVEQRAEPVLTLQQYFRPVRGGFQIFSVRGTCTMGFNAGNGLWVTASHCSTTQGGFDGTLFFQPTQDPLYNNLIGAELADPPFWTGGLCPTGKQCRWSDSLLATTNTGTSFDQGGIARTTGANNGSLTVSAGAPRFRITAEGQRPTAGEILNKVGRTTGWTQGPVDGVCEDWNLTGDKTLLCQDRVAANVAGGDSGSPVFKITNSPAALDVTLCGVLWGRVDLGGVVHFLLSAMYNVQLELGQRNTCAPGFTC